MATMNDELTKLWDALEKGTDEEYFAVVMRTIGTLASTMSLHAEHTINTIGAVQEYVDIEKTLYDDFNKALNALRTEALTMSEKQLSLLNDSFLTEVDTLTEKIYDRFVIVIGTAMINERNAWKKVPGMFKEIGDTPMSLERIVNAAKDVHAAIKDCDDRAKKVLSSLGGEETVSKYNEDLISYVLKPFEEENE